MTFRLALAFMMQNDAHWLTLHLPLFQDSGVFDGAVCVDGGSTDVSVLYVESLGVSVYRRAFDWNFGVQGNFLIQCCEAEGYDALLRIDPDETMFPQDMRRVREALQQHPGTLIGLQRRHFVGDRRHVHRDWQHDPQWRAWNLSDRRRYPEGQRVHEVPSHGVTDRLLLDDVYLFHYGYLKSAAEVNYRTAVYEALKQGVPLPKREDYADSTMDIPCVPYDGAQPLDPQVIGIHAPFEGEIA